MNEETLIFSGKKFISSRRASKLVGYSTDYIGQLARANKVESQMVGRTRFVGEASLLEYIHAGNGKSNGLINDNANHEPRVISGTPDQTLDIVFSSRAPKRNTRHLRVVSVLTLTFLFIGGAILVKGLPVGAGMDLLVGGLSDSSSYLALVDDEGSSVVVADKLKSVDDTVLPYFEKADSAIVSFFKKIRGRVLAWFKKETLITTETETRKEITTTVVTNNSSNTTAVGGDVIPTGLSEEELQKVVREIMLRERDVFAPGGPYGGIITLQSSGDPAKDAVTIEQIKKTFSDEVSVSFDQSGRSGVIKPVFRDVGDTDPYIFVLVPITE